VTMQNLDLIDWRMVGFASLWILGLAIVLSALGFADYRARISNRRTRQVLRRPGYRASVHGGLRLFCLGLAGSAGTWWEALLWGCLALAFAYSTLVGLCNPQSGPGTRSGDPADIQQRQRLAMKPGLTGPMQVGGCGALDLEERLQLELDYIRNYSLARDLAIFLRTPRVVFSGRGAL